MSGAAVVDTVPIERVVATTDGWRLSGQGDRFSAEASVVRAEGGRWDVTLDITAPTDRPEVTAGLVVAARLDLDGEAGGDDPRWLVPGLFYGDNRRAASRDRYPRFARGDGATEGDPFSARDWSFRSDRAAAPAVFASGGGVRACLAIGPVSEIGPTGIAFGLDGAVVELRVAAPYREEPVVYDGSSEPQPADTPVTTWAPGTTLRLGFRAYVVEDGETADREIVRDLDRWLGGTSPGARPDVMSLADAADLASDGLLRWHDRPRDSVIIETAAFARGDDPDAEVEGDRMAMHVGWLSGAPTAAALLVHGMRAGDQAAVASGRRVLDAIAANQSPSGTFWGQWTRDAGWGKGWTPGPDAVHGRTLAEAALFMIRAAVSSQDDRERWLDAVRANLDYVAGAQAADGSLPSDWDARSGTVLTRDGTSALAWIPAFVEYAAATGDAAFVDVARRAGQSYGTAVAEGDLRGAPEDVDVGPTSEDGYVAVMAYVALLAISADEVERRRWLHLATLAADWALTFRYLYDVALPPDSVLGRRGFLTRGLDQASPANQHLHTYGLVCVPEMVRLARATGDDHYVEASREHLAAARQCLVAEDGDLGGRRGMTPERYYQTRYGGPIGEVGRLSHAWCLGLLLHACETALEMPELSESQ